MFNEVESYLNKDIIKGDDDGTEYSTRRNHRSSYDPNWTAPLRGVSPNGSTLKNEFARPPTKAILFYFVPKE
jgi:hypothetical protein